MDVSAKPRFTSANAKHEQIQGKPLSQDSSCDDLTDSKYLNRSSNQCDDNLAVDRSPQAADTFTSRASQAPAFNAANWSPSLQTVLDQPPSALPGQLLLGGMVFCLAFGAWATLGQIDEVGHAQGRLVPQGEVYKIHPVELGKVANIAVKEGQAVKAGQVLVELDTQLAANEVDRLQQILTADEIQLRQTQTLIDRSRLEVATRAAIASADSQATLAAIAQAKSKADTARQLLSQLQANEAAYQGRLARLKPLEQQGAIAKENVFEAEQAVRDRQRAITESQGAFQEALVEVNRLQAELSQKQAQGSTAQLEAQGRIQELEVEMTQLKAKIAESKNLLLSARAKLVQRFLYATVDGFVSSLNIDNIGEVVQPGQTIAEIAPHNTPLVLSASLPNQEAGFVKTGMPVQVKFDAYPYQDYGIVPGKVVSISPDAKQDERLGAVYKVEVALDRNYVTANHPTIKFKAGQTATADIILRRRRIADVLLDPIRQLQKGGMNL